MKPRTIFNFSTGVDLFRNERVSLSTSLDVQNLADRLFVYNFESVFSGTPSVRLDYGAAGLR